MTGMFKKYQISGIILFLFVWSSLFYSAQAAPLTASDPDDAFQNVLQTILNDQDAARALSTLKKMIVEERWVRGDRLKMEQAAELLGYIQFLKNRLSQLENRYSQLWGFLRDAPGGSDSLPDEKVKQLAEASGVGLEEKDDILVGQKGIDDLLTVLKMRKADYVQRIQTLRQKNEELSALISNLAIERTSKNLSGASTKDERGQSGQVKRQVEALNREVAAKSLELFEKDNMVVEQKGDLRKVEKELFDVQQRLDLTQRIIQEKDGIIDSLEAHLERLKTQPDPDSQRYQQQFEAVQLKLSVLEDRLEKQNLLSETRLVALEKLLADQEKRIAGFGIIIKEKNQEIALLDQALSAREFELMDLHKVLSSQDDKIIELDGIIQIYKAKLKDLRERIASSEEAGVLTQHIDHTQRQLDQSQTATEDLYQRILALESQFPSLKP